MRLRLKRDPSKVGRSDEWTASIDVMPRVGIGKSRTEAVGSLVRANLGSFRIDEIDDLDPDASPPEVAWRAEGRTP